MLNTQQIQIADYLLNYLKANGGKSSKDDYPEKLQAQNFDRWECNYTTIFLIDQSGLVDYLDDSRYYISLTTNGYHAAEIGLEKYFKKIDQDKELDREAKNATIEGVKTAKIVSKISLVFSGIAILISIYSIRNKVLGYQNDNANANGSNRKSDGNSIYEYDTLDSITIEKFKHSLKHDSVFLNEIKQLIIVSDPKITPVRSK